MREKKGVIKLLFLLPTFTFGGAERTSLNLLRGIDKNRFKICLTTSRQVFTHYQNIDIEKFVAIEDLGLDVWFSSLRRFVHDVRKVTVLLGREQPDIAFGMMHYPSSLLSFAKKLFNLNVKVIASPRGPSVEYLRHFEKKFIKKIYLRWVFGFFCRYADGIVVSSQGMKAECINNFNGNQDKIRVISNSVDFNDIERKAREDANLNIPSGFMVISTSGRLAREKNMSCLIKAFSVVRKNEKVKLLIVGEGPERGNLESLSDELGIREDVVFVGYQQNPYKFMKRSDIFVHTCLFEGFANSIIEAMACGVPVIAVDCPYGPRDIIKHGESGFLVTMDDEGALEDAIRTFLRNSALRASIARKGYERAKEFSIGNMVEQYEYYFNQVCS